MPPARPTTRPRSACPGRRPSTWRPTSRAGARNGEFTSVPVPVPGRCLGWGPSNGPQPTRNGLEAGTGRAFRSGGKAGTGSGTGTGTERGKETRVQRRGATIRRATMRLHFRKISQAMFAAALLIGVMADQAQAAQEPIRLGVLTTKTGPLAAPGQEMENGIVLFLEEHNYTLAGRKVELTSQDTATQPPVTLTKTRELVERTKAHIIIGPLAAFEAYAIIQYVNDSKVPLISPSAAADDLTQRKASTYFFRAASTSSQPMHPLGTYAAKTLGYKRISTIADDFAFGHELVAGFHRSFEDAGGQIVQKLWPPLGTRD